MSPDYLRSQNRDIRKAADPNASLEVRLFGGFTALVGGKPLPSLRSRREQWLLALLVLRHDRDTDREWLATTLWPDNDEKQALFYLRKSLSNLRTALGDESARILSPSPKIVRLDLTGAFSDVAEFDAAVETSSPDSMRKAIDLYKGPLLPECLEDWAAPERSQRENAYISTLDRLARADVERGDPSSATRWLRLLIAADPYRESAYVRLMQTLADCGDRAALTTVYRDLQERLLHDLNSAPSPETDAVYKELRHRERQSLPLASHTPIENNRHLPVPLTDLIGRETEIKEILSWMKQRRLVTLVGAGGIGKTRLAIAIAEAALPQFEHGVWFVDLAPITDPNLIPQATAKALGIAEQQDRPLKQTIAEALCAQPLLLVLDNCEQFTESCAEFVQYLLSFCDRIYIIATSREALHVDGEQVLRVPSLPVPSTDIAPESLMDFEAVQLFVDRATRADSSFRLTPKNSGDVVEICRQLDGIALAIEMAAARLRSLSVGEIKNRLADRFRLLTTGSKGSLPRQHTLRAAIDWSYDHLSEPDRHLLRSVSVFSGGWTLDAAAAVAGSDSKDDVQDLLSNLVEKSLMIAEMGEDETRYRLLETVKQYGHYKLAESEQLRSTRVRHRDFYLAYALEIRPKLMAADQARWFSVLDAEHDNLRQAIRFCIEDGDGQAGLKIVAAIIRFWIIRNHYSEGRETFAAINAVPSAQLRTKERTMALSGVGLLAWRQSDYKAAEAIYAESISIARELGEELDIARALNNLALITRDQGDYDSAQSMHEESIALFKKNGEMLIAAICLSNLGIVHHYKGDLTVARTILEEGLAVQRELGERSSTSTTLNSLGEVALEQNDHDFARTCHEEGLQIARELEDKYWSARHQFGLGCAAVKRVDLEQAKELLRQSLPAVASLGELTLVTDHLTVFASIAMKEQQSARAVHLLGAREVLRDATGSPLPKYARENIDRDIAALKKALGKKSFEEAWQSGQATSMDQAIAYALES